MTKPRHLWIDWHDWIYSDGSVDADAEKTQVCRRCRLTKPYGVRAPYSCWQLKSGIDKLRR